jgi:hypothetical protein
MKTIESRLQSRISRRRNVIRDAEDEVSMLVQRRKWLQEDGDAPYAEHAFVTDSVKEGRKFISTLADDQKLDKKLKIIVGAYSYNRRLYGIGDF